MKTKVTAFPNGPLLIQGNFKIKGVDKNTFPPSEKVFLCRCVKSAKMPFCDGAHKR